MPVFSTRNMRFGHATSWLEGFEGLSRLITPYCMCSLIGLFSGEFPQGIGVWYPVLVACRSSSAEGATWTCRESASRTPA